MARALVLGFALAAVACSDGPKADGTLLTPYLALGDSLADDRVDGLAKWGAALSEVAETKRAEPGVAAVIGGASAVEYGDIAAARGSFKIISRGMIEHLKSSAGDQADHMIVHCPMTFAGDGAYWVQKRGPVRNPYEGARMLHCGDLVDWADDLPD